MPQEWYVAGEWFIQTLQGYRNPVLDVIFALASFMGEEWFYLLVLPLLYWCVDASLGRWAAYALLLSAWTNSALKYLWNTPRPPSSLWRNLIVRPTGPGFPSGHAQTSAVVWGTVAWRERKVAGYAGATVLVALISLSRIYNGVHYPHDVVGGLVFGLIGLALLVVLGPRVAAVASSWSVGRVALVTFLVALILLLLHPAENGRWPAGASVPAIATLWGMSVGFALERTRVKFQVEGSLLRRGVRFLTGLVLVMAVYVGLRLVLAVQEPYGLYLSLRALRYALVGLTVSWGAPALFVRLRL